ncbi:MAG: DUF2808 domain-containing protein [Pseudanabaena sp. LacPavin_0818_WC45_MAG_42_6]|nr:DUF2808 domain-containing protein [Pseudanabaena sp. LacPavin_0818_WC45_MAG_42_6]
MRSIIVLSCEIYEDPNDQKTGYCFLSSFSLCCSFAICSSRPIQSRIYYFWRNNGSFDTSDMKLRVTDQCRGGRDLEIESATWDKETRRITIIPKEAIPSKTAIRAVLSNVRNPDFSGFYQFDGRVMRFDVPVPEYIGSWVITLD